MADQKKAAATNDAAKDAAASEETSETAAPEVEDVQVEAGPENVLGVTVFGAEMLHPKILVVIEAILEKEKANELKAIHFSDGNHPEGKYGTYLPDMQSMVIYLPKCLEGAVETLVQQPEIGMSVLGMFWLNITHVTAHELFHDIAYATAPDKNDLPDHEEEAHQFGDEIMSELAKTVDFDPPPAEEIPWFHKMIMEIMVEKVNQGNEAWVKAQQEMMEKGLIFKSENAEATSMKTYFELTAKVKWDTPTNNYDGLEVVPDVPDAKPTEITNAEDAEALEAMEQLGGYVEETQVGDTLGIEAQPFIPPSGPAPTAAPNSGVVTPTPGADIPPWQAPTPAAPAAAPVQSGPVTFGPGTPAQTPTPMGDPNMGALLHKVYEAAYNHMFSMCGWNGAGYFTNPLGVYQPVTLPADAAHLITQFESVSNGQKGWYPSNGQLVGELFKNGTLPAYHFEINTGSGTIKRKILAQNPEKGSRPAQEALSGICIAYLLDAADGTFKGVWKNGVFSPL